MCEVDFWRFYINGLQGNNWRNIKKNPTFLTFFFFSTEYNIGKKLYKRACDSVCKTILGELNRMGLNRICMTDKVNSNKKRDQM